MSARKSGVTYVRLCHDDGTTLPLNVRRCNTFICRWRGLMFRRALPNGEGLLFDERVESRVNTTIHMFFVFFSIGVIWLADDGTVVDTKLAKPFRPYYAPQAAARYFLEGPPALLDQVRVGERLAIEPLAT